MIQKCSKKIGKSGKMGLTWGAVAPIVYIPSSYSVRLSRFWLLVAPIRRDSRGLCVTTNRIFTKFLSEIDLEQRKFS